MKKLIILCLCVVLLTGCVVLLAGCTVKNKNSEQKQNENNQVSDESLRFTPEYEEKLEDKMEEEENKRKKEDFEMWSELEQSEIDKVDGKGTKGSCNSINEDSTCIEFYGSFYTEESMRLGCDGIFSSESCPEGMNGGCNTGIGTQADMVAWMYLSGGGEMTTASMKNAAKACNSAPVSRWIQVK